MLISSHRWVETVAPTSEPVTLDEVKHQVYAQCGDADNALLETLITTARQKIRDAHGLSCVNATYQAMLDGFPFSSIITLPVYPLQSIESIIYTDINGDQQTIDSADYTVDTISKPGRVQIVPESYWPSTKDIIGSVNITFIAGHGDDPALVPLPIKQAIKLLCGHYYANREDTIAGMSMENIPSGYAFLLGDHVTREIA